MEAVIRQEAKLLKFASLSDAERLHLLEDSMIRLTDQASIVQKTLEESKYLELLRWISPSPYTRHHEALAATRMPNSASWVLSHDRYRSWKNASSSSILLLHGIPGSGKSHICSAVVDNYLAERQLNPLAAPMAYYYCDDCGFELERSQATNVLRSILRQLTIPGHPNQPTIRDNIALEFDRRLSQSRLDGMELSRLAIDDCVRLILEVTATDPVSILVDGLDTVNHRDRPALVRAFDDIIHKSSNVVNIFLTSRYDSQIFSLLESSQATPVTYLEVTRDSTLRDMGGFVSLQVAQAIKDRRLLKKDPSNEFVRLLEEKLVDGAGEMFQWAKIQIEYLCQLNREEDITRALESGDMATLDDAYTRVLDQIMKGGSSSREIAIHTFSWLLHMREALSPETFLGAVLGSTAAVDLKEGQRELLTICASLVIFDINCNTFRFSHQSVKEFLQLRLFTSQFSGQEMVARRCLQVCMDGPADGIPPEDSGPLYRYAALYWAHHCSRAIVQGQDLDLESEITSFVVDEPGDVSLSFIGWTDHVASISSCLHNDHLMKVVGEAMPSPEGSPLFAASAFGLDCLLSREVLGDEPIDWDQKNNLGHTSLYIASASGSFSIAQALLSKQADPNVKCGRFGTALQAACFAGHANIVEALLRHGVAARESGLFLSPMEACFRGNSQECALALLEHEDTITDAKSFDDAIGGAAEAGFLRVIDQLRKSAFAIGSEDKMKAKTTRAIKGGQVGALAAFVRTKTNPRDMLPDDAIAIAAAYGHEQIIDFLATMGMSFNYEGFLGSPLRCAALMGYDAVLRTLIELGADVNQCGQHGTPLQAASMKGHKQMVDLLLRNGAQVNQQGGRYGTALEAAAFHGHRGVVETLLDAGAEVHVRDSKGTMRDALHAAATGGSHGIVQVLLDRGFNFFKDETRPMRWQLSDRTPYAPLLRNLSPDRSVQRQLPFERLGRPDRWDESPGIRDSNHVSKVRDRASSGDESSFLESASHSNQQLESLEGELSSDQHDGKDISPFHTGRRALQASIIARDTDEIALLLKDKQAAKITDNDISSSLRFAVMEGHLATLTQLFQALPPSALVENLFQWFGVAVQSNHENIVNYGIEQLQILIRDWNKIDARNIVQVVCLAEMRVAKNIMSVISANASHGKIEKILESLLNQAIDHGRMELFLWILEKYSVLEETIRLIFDRACEKGSVDAVQALARKADKDYFLGIIPQGLTTAAANDHPSLVDCLLNHLLANGKEVRLGPPLIAGASNGCTAAVRALLDWKSTWATNGWVSAAMSLRRIRSTWAGSGSVASVVALLEFRATSKAHKTAITRALTIALQYGHEECAKILLTAGADINAAVPSVVVDPSSLYTPAGWPEDQYEQVRGSTWLRNRRQIPGPRTNALQAALSGPAAEKVIPFLLSSGCDANLLGGSEKYPIIVAVEKCSVQVIRSLLEGGANPNIVSGKINAILAAVRRECSSNEILQLLFQAGARIEPDICTVDELLKISLEFFSEDGRFSHTETLEDAVRRGPGAAAQSLLRAVPSMQATQANFTNLLQAAIAVGDQACIDLLLERGVDVHSVHPSNGTPLHTASRFGHVALVQYLLKADVDPNILQGHQATALRAAVIGSHTSIVEALLQSGAKVNQKLSKDPRTNSSTETLLDIAARLGDSDIVQLLVSAGIHVLSDYTSRCHPLVKACETSSIEAISCLINSGAAAGLVKRQHQAHEVSPLHMACYHGREDVVQLLLDRHVGLDLAQEGSASPLLLASQAGHVNVVRLLREKVRHKSSS